MLKVFDVNEVGTDFVVGDIHGCFTLLESELKGVSFDPSKDRLFSVGDLVDRGPESHRALEFLTKPWFHAVLGNHEDMAIKYFYKEWPENNYSRNGGDWFISLPTEEQEVFVNAFCNLPLSIQVGDIGIIHAEPPYDWGMVDNMSEYQREQAVWGRSLISEHAPAITIENIRKVFVGHTILPKPTVKGNINYIDTGGYAYNKLTLRGLE